MNAPFIGSEALAAGVLTRGQLRWRYTSAHPGVYLPKNAVATLADNTMAAWLWTGRRGIIAGRAAAALHGAQWVDDDAPVELIAEHGRRRRGVIVREERIRPDEICRIGEFSVTTPLRTALDLARFLPRDDAVAHLDALAIATGVEAEPVLELAARYRSLRGIRSARTALDLMDPGGQSPKETWLRLLLIDAGFRRPRTQIRVTDGFAEAFIHMGYDDVKVGLDYLGKHHATDRPRYVHDIGRNALIEREGWINIHVVAEHSKAFILHRVREAFARRDASPFST
ncbi:hypothetical protein A5746_13790 [Mycolicibacterium conceptionense]|uniref:hypothetical protein n=1 Tax=Mycolicibacterium conceptionense TaxID=451644 RepID=UPI0007EDBC06|nr:hypothetical protein [Mycolicibacterium conceptionense]OBK03975.1 hypothetical protein A5639_21645 [Mycolicibacterium conceptionense]OMB75218.1 hypothetical protein A5741_03320 [Mycolicibacterium conceptionense]OMB99217.1 hypothetical protein A5746_13790 [Mycolicibacterium conceptionense]